MKIFLFDMDGVLLEAQGYHRALQETVRRMALALGFGDVTVSRQDIFAFEAGGISSEWDEAALITARLMETVWKDESERELPLSLAEPATVISDPRPCPDLARLAWDLSTPEMLPLHPLERAGRYFLHKPDRTHKQERILHDLILGARMAESSLTHRTFQELVLGSAEFRRVYGLTPEMECESYLLQYDLSNLPEGKPKKDLMDWLSTADHTAAIITSRPSRAPAGVFSTPEAEFGAKLAGLEDVPILGWGGLCWLGLQTHVNPQSFCKPSPVHALAAMRLAVGVGQETALTEAADLVRYGLASPDWDVLRGIEVTVFEDTPGGIRSLQAAAKVLGKLGVALQTCYFGIAREEVKVKALKACSARVFPSLTEALEAAY